jgi:hypothetical protein
MWANKNPPPLAGEVASLRAGGGSPLGEPLAPSLSHKGSGEQNHPPVFSSAVVRAVFTDASDSLAIACFSDC